MELGVRDNGLSWLLEMEKMMDKTIKQLLDYLAFDIGEAYQALDSGSNDLIPLAAAIEVTATELHAAVHKSRGE